MTVGTARSMAQCRIKALHAESGLSQTARQTRTTPPIPLSHVSKRQAFQNMRGPQPSVWIEQLITGQDPDENLCGAESAFRRLPISISGRVEARSVLEVARTEAAEVEQQASALR